jgi:hypothetical protein
MTESSRSRLERSDFQVRTEAFMMACFGRQIADDVRERNHRFIEEALELVQATGCTAAEANMLVDYVIGRPTGEAHLETGAVMLTLAALCNALGLSMDGAADDELERVWGKIDRIREKQKTKPRNSPLPVTRSESATNRQGPHGANHAVRGNADTCGGASAPGENAAPACSSDKPSNADTPRTDAQHAKWRIHDDPYTGMVNHARQLERELAAMTKLNRLHVQQLNERPVTPSHVAQSGEPTPDMIRAGVDASRAFMQRCEDDAKARGLSGSTYVYSNWQLVEAILRAALSITESASGELSIAKALLRAHNNERHGHLIKADDYYGAVARALEIVAAESRRKE